MRALILAAALLIPAGLRAEPEELALGSAAVTQEAGELQLTASSGWRADDGRSSWTVSGEVEYGVTGELQLGLEAGRAVDDLHGAWSAEGSLLARAAGGPRWRLLAGAAVAVEHDGMTTDVAIEPVLAAGATRGRWGVNLAAAADVPVDDPSQLEASVALALYARWPWVTPVVELGVSSDGTTASMSWAAGAVLALTPATITVGLDRAEADGGLGGRIVASWDLDLAAGDDP